MILNIATVLTDLIHLLKIFLFCDLLFGFEKRKETKRYVLSYSLVAVSSEIIYCANVEIMELILYLATISLVLCIVYREKRMVLILSAIWLTLITSMIDTINSILISMVYSLTGIKNSDLQGILASLMSLFFVVAIGKIYKKKYDIGIKRIGIKKLAFFTILALADNFVALTIMIMGKNASKQSYAMYFFTGSIFVIIGMLIQLGTVILLFISNSIYKERDELMKRYLNEQKEHYEYLEQREEETKKFRHDLRKHIQMLYFMKEQGKYDDFDDYLEQMNIRIDNFGNRITVNNGIADAVINKYYEEAVSKGIDMVVKGNFPSECGVDAYDLCTVLSNILSNAIEASEKVSDKKIFLECRYTEDEILILEKNDYKDEGQFEDGTFITSKANKEKHGFGMKNINDAIKRNGGTLHIETRSSKFSITVMLKNTLTAED